MGCDVARKVGTRARLRREPPQNPLTRCSFTDEVRPGYNMATRSLAFQRFCTPGRRECLAGPLPVSSLAFAAGDVFNRCPRPAGNGPVPEVEMATILPTTGEGTTRQTPGAPAGLAEGTRRRFHAAFIAIPRRCHSDVPAPEGENTTDGGSCWAVLMADSLRMLGCGGLVSG